MALENDVILVYFEDNPVAFARIEDITADIKPDWYQVKLLMLQLPLQTVTWILREEYINGQEFTMGGKRMRIEEVNSPEESDESGNTEFEEKKEEIKPKPKGFEKVISFAERKKMKK